MHIQGLTRSDKLCVRIRNAERLITTYLTIQFTKFAADFFNVGFNDLDSLVKAHRFLETHYLPSVSTRAVGRVEEGKSPDEEDVILLRSESPLSDKTFTIINKLRLQLRTFLILRDWFASTVPFSTE